MPNDFNVGNAVKQLIWTGVIINIINENSLERILKISCLRCASSVIPSCVFAGLQ